VAKDKESNLRINVPPLKTISEERRSHVEEVTNGNCWKY